MGSQKPKPAIRACLFDMDGLLIDSEDKYTIATNAVLREYGKPDLPWSIKAQLQGRPGPAAGAIFSAWAQLPVSREVYMEKVQAMQREIFPDCQPLPGVPSLLSTLHSHTSVKIALATSSHKGNFQLKTTHLRELFSVFGEENRVMGDDPRIGKGRGKPAPDIYLLALETINVGIRREGREREILPEECLVFEDSVPGVESGRRAGMQCVWVPHLGLLNEYRGREGEVLAGLTGQYEENEENNEKLGVMKGDGSRKTAGAPGEVGDGWAKLLGSLENFPYEEFGIAVKEDTRL